MKALILAAGRGSRLRNLTKNKPKALLDIGGITILDYQLKLLEMIVGLCPHDIFVVGGYKFDTLQYLSKKGINLIYNPKYLEYNNIYSFYLAREHITEDFLLLNGDTIIHPEILRKLMINANNGTFFVVDNIKTLGKEEMKVIIKKDKILRFGKDIPPHESQGEYIGLAKFNLSEAKIIFDIIGKLIKEGKTHLWYELGINYSLKRIYARAWYTNGLPWIEVDTPEDYEKAKKLFDILKPELKFLNIM